LNFCQEALEKNKIEKKSEKKKKKKERDEKKQRKKEKVCLWCQSCALAKRESWIIFFLALMICQGVALVKGRARFICRFFSISISFFFCLTVSFFSLCVYVF
jgi:hypothetical protein